MTRVGRRPRALALVLLVAVSVAAGARPTAAQESGPAIEVSGIDVQAYPQVRLTVSVPPDVASGGLDPDDLQVSENGEKVDATVTPLGDESLGVVLVVDTSGSIEEALGDAKAAATDLLAVLPDSAAVSVVGFGTTAQVVSPFTSDRQRTVDAIEGLSADGGTALYDAAVLAAEEAARSGADRNVIVLLSDGADSESLATLQDATTALGNDVHSFYAVSLETQETDDQALGQLAEAVGGRVVSAADPEALADTYLELGQRIVNSYEVVFTSVSAERIGNFAVSIAGSDVTGELDLVLPNEDASGSDLPAADEPRQVGVLTSDVEPNLLQQPWALWLGALLVVGAVAIAVFLAVPAASGSGAGRYTRRRLRGPSLATDAVAEDGGGGAERALVSVRDAATRVAAAAIERTSSTGKVDAALDRAGLIMRAGEYVTVVVAVSVGAGLLGYLLLGPVGAAMGLFVPLLGARAFLQFKAARRNEEFAGQLADALQIMSGALRSGFGLGQAIDTAAEEMDDPIGAEFRRAILESRLGRDVEDALQGVADRVQNEDFEWVIDAMRINRQVGGDLAQILDQVGETIRARNRLKRQVAALTAEGRISAYVLGFLPIGMGLILYSSNPDYMDPLFSRTVGLIMLGVAVGLLVAGALWLKKMIDIEY